jgi:hypothetical protein
MLPQENQEELACLFEIGPWGSPGAVQREARASPSPRFRAADRIPLRDDHLVPARTSTDAADTR